MNLRELDKLIGEKVEEPNRNLIHTRGDKTVYYGSIEGVPVRYFLDRDGKLDYEVVKRGHRDGHMGGIAG